VLAAVGYPYTLDLRTNMMPVRDQGSQGSCAAMAGSAMKEWQERIDFLLDEYLSPQFIYAGSTCTHTVTGANQAPKHTAMLTIT
jgi:hypothetical protein